MRSPVSKSHHLQCREWLGQKTVEISQSQYLDRPIQLARVVQTDPEDLERLTCPTCLIQTPNIAEMPAGLVVHFKVPCER